MQHRFVYYTEILIDSGINVKMLNGGNNIKDTEVGD